jgi:hypothetical protein
MKLSTEQRGVLSAEDSCLPYAILYIYIKSVRLYDCSAMLYSSSFVDIKSAKFGCLNEKLSSEETYKG